MKKLLDGMTQFMLYIILALFTLITIVLAGSILTRFIQGFLPQGFDIQLPWAEEVIKYALLWVCYLGAAILVREKGHFGLGFLSRQYPESRVIPLIAYLCSALVAFIMVYYGTLVTLSMRIQRTPTLQISKTWIEMIFPIAGLLMLIFIVEGLVKLIREGAKQ